MKNLLTLIIGLLILFLPAALAGDVIVQKAGTTISGGSGDVPQTSANYYQDAGIAVDSVTQNIAENANTHGSVVQTDSNYANIQGAPATPNTEIIQTISQIAAAGGEIVQTANNWADPIRGNDAIVGQSITQAALANGNIGQFGDNYMGYVLGNDAVVNQAIVKTAYSDGDIKQVDNNYVLYAGSGAQNPRIGQYIYEGADALGDIVQDAHNTIPSVYFGDNPVMSQAIAQTALGDYVQQYSVNYAAVNANDNVALAQHIDSAAQYNTLTKFETNFADVNVYARPDTAGAAQIIQLEHSADIGFDPLGDALVDLNNYIRRTTQGGLATQQVDLGAIGGVFRTFTFNQHNTVTS
jgi:hypothetical protein